MKIKRAFCLLLSLCFVSAFFALKLSADEFDEIALTAHEYGVRDYSVSVIDNGIIKTSSSREDENLTFEAGSISKPITAYICLRLAEEGLLSLDDNITEYLSGKWITSDKNMKKITIRQLLSHTAGFSPSYELGVDRKIYFEPGSRFSYSGVGYIYLQKIIENVYGGTLEEAANEYVFKPLNMKNSTFAKAKTVTPYVNSSFLILCTLGVWCIFACAVFIVGIIIGFITKFKLFIKINLLFFSIITGFAADLILLIFIMPRLIIPALILGFVGFLILCIFRKRKSLSLFVFSGFILVVATVGLALPLSLPIGPEIPEKPQSSAYSLKTTSHDLALFANELIKIYQNDTEIMNEITKPQVEISESNSWGAGLGIETHGENFTLWHSGINPGMQSLMVIDPTLKKAVVIMTNSESGLNFAVSITEDFLETDGQWEITRADLSGS
jgi:CubicO group peptidase (beta-lactamase class C family)